MLKDIPIPIGAVIRDIREKCGYTQTQLAKQTGLDPRTITAIEKGRIANPALVNLKKIATALNLSLRDLFGKAEAELPNHFAVGTQRGEFALDYPKHRFRIVSYLPQNLPFFAGKLIVESKGRLDPTILKFPGFVFLQMVLGKLQFSLEGKDIFLKEGQNLFFDGRLKYSFQNPIIRETTALLIAIPSFLKSE